VGRHYYVVGEAADAESAVAVALARAADSVECEARGDAEIDGVEVRKLLWNPLGWAYLAGSVRNAAQGGPGTSPAAGRVRTPRRASGEPG
jgi:hypothetical protein